MEEIELIKHKLKREKNARKEAETIAEAKSLELYQSNLELRDLLRCNTLQYEVARILAETTNLKTALKLILKKIRDLMQFEFGGIWLIDKEKKILYCAKVYPSDNTDYKSFITETMNTTLAIGIGLPGRVWQTKKSSWIDDVTNDNNFPRIMKGTEYYLRSACAFPIISKNKVIGVMEFFLHSIYPYGEHLMSTFSDISRQIHNFNESKQVAEKVETARIAGMAEVMVSVLHNVGNIINGINTSIYSLMKEQHRSKIFEKLEKVSELVQSHLNDSGDLFVCNPKGALVYDYLQKLSLKSKTEHNDILEELQFMQTAVQHIINIITTQQTLTSTRELIEAVSIPEQLDEAIELIGFSESFTIERLYNVKQLILLDKIKLMQILVNLLRNAKEAIELSNSNNKKITLVVERNSDTTICIQVIDNGIGIPDAIASKIFTFRFTTKKQGHGIGLHSSVLLAKDMNGTLTFAKNSNDQGTTFALELPYRTT